MTALSLSQPKGGHHTSICTRWTQDGRHLLSHYWVTDWALLLTPIHRTLLPVISALTPALPSDISKHSKPYKMAARNVKKMSRKENLFSPVAPILRPHHPYVEPLPPLTLEHMEQTIGGHWPGTNLRQHGANLSFMLRQRESHSKRRKAIWGVSKTWNLCIR